MSNAPKTIDVNLLNPFISAAVECLTQMAGLKPTRKRLFMKTDPRLHGDVAGIIGMTNGITGACVVAFPNQLARNVVARFLGEDPANLTPEMVQDGIGEVANMVAGAAKRKFVGTAYRFDISTPTVVAGGQPLSIHNPNGSVSIASEFTAMDDWAETFMVEISLKPTDKA